MVAVLDILQSIPVLSFLPPVVLAMIALVPGHQMGIEMGVILLIFTGQVWNLAFSFYSSLKSIPREMIEASRIYRYSAWQRFWQLEMPYAAIGLVWNSIVSVAGGWFALIACEMFTMGDRNFQLPGLGSYLQTATVRRRHPRPDQRHRRRHPHRRRHRSACLAAAHRLERQVQIRAGRVRRPRHFAHPRAACAAPPCSAPFPAASLRDIEEPIFRRMARTAECRIVQPLDEDQRARLARCFGLLPLPAIAVACWGATQAALMLSTVTWPDLRLLLEGAGATFLRVNAVAAHLRRVDHSRRRRHRSQSPTRPHRAAHRAGAGLGPRHGLLPDPAHRPRQNRRRTRHRLHCS